MPQTNKSMHKQKSKTILIYEIQLKHNLKLLNLLISFFNVVLNQADNNIGIYFDRIYMDVEFIFENNLVKRFKMVMVAA